jgi:hypothetical protein
MIAGEFNFDDYMYGDNTEAYYKLAYLIYILFAVVMTILVTNLLIGKSTVYERALSDFIYRIGRR